MSPETFTKPDPDKETDWSAFIAGMTLGERVHPDITLRPPASKYGDDGVHRIHSRADTPVVTPLASIVTMIWELEVKELTEEVPLRREGVVEVGK